jgi:serine/threonine-protein kinase
MATEDLLVGRTLEGRYRILERIARGGMSTVYSAVDERLDRLVAVKVMSSALSTDPAFSDRFTREARAAARLTHLNTVAVYDQGAETGPDGHHVFLVMELVHGRTLRDLIRERSAPFPPAEAISLIQPVLSALSAAHAAGIVHRDVKPENILLSDDGVVKVADFGLARAVEADASSTRTGLMMGTVAYCSPEQITRGEADPRSDVYAAGIVLFELLTGRPPFQGESAMNVAYQHVNGRVPAPSSKVRGVPSELDELVVLATDPDRDERPADAGEFLAEIADVRERLHLPIVPVPTRPAASRRGRPPLGRAGADADTTALVPGAGAHDTKIVRQQLGAARAPGQQSGPPPRRADGPPPPVVIPPSRHQQLSPRQRQRRRGLIVLLVVLVLGLAAGAAGWWFASGRFSTVPSVSGDSQSQARQAIESAGFDYAGVAESRYSETVPAGDVIGTKPGSGSRHVHGTDISLVVSLGPQRIGVPDVHNLSADDASAAITKVGLPAPQIVTEHSAHVDNGNAIKTVPAAGKKVRKTTVVKLYVSLGPPIISVPDIAPGTSYHDAVAALQDAHLNPVRGASKYSDSVPKGTVISVSPNDRATEFSNVTIIVSRGPRMVTIPDIARGSSASDAKAQLEAMNLKVNLEPFLPFAGTDHVYSVDPGPGQSVPVGSTVTITTY